MTRRSVRIPPAGGLSQRDVSGALAVADEWLLQRFTPASASDASAPNIRFAYDDDYFYVQLETGQWKRAAIASW